MNLASLDFSKKQKRMVIFAVTLGNLLEWYELYLFVYWAPIIAELFFDSNSEYVNLTYTFLIFGMGFLARPLGGVFFGRLGDRIGRRKSMLLSMLMMTVPTFITGLLPTQAMIGSLAPILLGFMRLFQSFPAGGEHPGASCYPYENSKVQNRRFMSSWGAFGFQVGILISTVECFFLEKYLPYEDLITWGWRLSFIVGGLIGLCGLFLRYRLHETPLYREMLSHEQIVKEPLLEVVQRYWKKMLLGVGFCALNSSAFYLLTVNLPVYFGKILGISYKDNLIITMFLLILITVPLPLFGKLADRFDNQKMLVASTIGIILLLYPIYFTINHPSLVLMGVLILIFSLFFTFLSALIPYLLSDLFPTHARFTCVGISFNVVDALIGGFTPVVALYLLHLTGQQGAFCWFLLFCALLSLGSYLAMKEKHPPHL